MELKYITQDNIDESHINITSAEMFKEFQEYNGLMLRMQKKRARFWRDFCGMVIMNALLIPIGVIFSFISPLYKITGMLLPNYILMFISMALFVYFIIIRKIYNWKIGLVLSFILVLVNIGFIILAVANPVIIYMIEKTDRSIRNETGYPHFTQLHGSYKSMVKDGEVFGIESEGVYATGMKSENVVPEDPFAKYRIKPEDDMGMLADTDISDLRSN